jgi:hypothetical protein
MYKQVNYGGSGLFEINTFLNAQKCSWVRRSLNLNDQWKALLYVKNFGVPLNCNPCNINPLEYPVLYTITRSFNLFSESFTKHNENYKESFIFENKSITRALNSRELLSRNLFSRDFFTTHAHLLYKLRFSNFYLEDNTIVPANTIRDVTQIPFSEILIQTIRGACFDARIKFKKN